MIVKQRNEPKELKLFRSLHARMNLPESESNYLLNLEKGYKGEKKFDGWLKNISDDDWIILPDLLLECNHSIIQIDTLLIAGDTIYLFEIKNYEGDFYISNGKWYSISGAEIKNPLLQIERTESSFRRLLHDLGFKISIKSYLIFINANFHLYQAPMNQPIIFPTQLNRFSNKLNSVKLNKRHKKIAEKLISIQVKESPYMRLPSYEYELLEKGVLCSMCNSFVNSSLVCNKCGNKEDQTSAILRSVNEFMLLFPERKITTNAIFDWCKVIESKKTIRRILSGNFEVKGTGRSTYYVNLTK